MPVRTLGRIPPPDDKHLQKYSLTRDTLPEKPTPVCIGINWYDTFDEPEADGLFHASRDAYWIGRKDFGQIRGGHEICLKPPRLGDNTQWWTRYNQGEEGACFPADTRIRRADGSWARISDLRLLDAVQTAEGNTGSVSALSVRWHDRGLVHLQLRGMQAGLRLTPEHPVLTERGYVPAKDLTPGELVALPRYCPGEDVLTIDTSRFVPRRSPSRSTAIGTRNYPSIRGGSVTANVTAVPERLALTPELGELLGLYLAEGAASQQKVIWTFGGHGKDTLVSRCIALVEEALGASPRKQVRGNGAINVILYGTDWVKVFSGLCNTGSGEKHVPTEVFQAPSDVRRAVVEGWLAGAGVTISQDLALGMYALANDLGLSPTLSRREPTTNSAAKTRRSIWEVSLAEGNGIRPRQDARTVWRKVSRVTLEDWRGFVYNLTVSGDHSFVADGFGVHNCTGFAAARMMSLLNRQTYNGFAIYEEAKKLDEFPGEDYDGTTSRAAMEVLRTQGPCRMRGKKTYPACPDDGIHVYRWARNVEEIAACLSPDDGGRHILDLGYVEFLNSWGRDYPHITRIPLDALHRLVFAEEGDAALVTDK